MIPETYFPLRFSFTSCWGKCTADNSTPAASVIPPRIDFGEFHICHSKLLLNANEIKLNKEAVETFRIPQCLVRQTPTPTASLSPSTLIIQANQSFASTVTPTRATSKR